MSVNKKRPMFIGEQVKLTSEQLRALRRAARFAVAAHEPDERPVETRGPVYRDEAMDRRCCGCDRKVRYCICDVVSEEVVGT